jgi:hypothetical protein
MSCSRYVNLESAAELFSPFFLDTGAALPEAMVLLSGLYPVRSVADITWNGVTSRNMLR